MSSVRRRGEERRHHHPAIQPTAMLTHRRNEGREGQMSSGHGRRVTTGEIKGSGADVRRNRAPWLLYHKRLEGDRT